MEKENIKDRFQDTAEDLLEYGKLQLDSLKLRLLSAVSTLSNNIFSVFLLVLTGAIAVVFLAATLTLLLADWTGSLLLATAIMTAVFIILVLVVYFRRKKMFINMMVRMWSKMLFEKEKE